MLQRRITGKHVLLKCVLIDEEKCVVHLGFKRSYLTFKQIYCICSSIIGSLAPCCRCYWWQLILRHIRVSALHVLFGVGFHSPWFHAIQGIDGRGCLGWGDSPYSCTGQFLITLCVARYRSFDTLEKRGDINLLKGILQDILSNTIILTMHYCHHKLA